MSGIIEADLAKKLAGLQIDLLQKIRNGQKTLDDLEWFNLLSVKNLRELRGQNTEDKEMIKIPYLRLISGGRNLKISACAGGPRSSLAYAKETFFGYLDNSFKNWNLDTNQPATSEAEAEVWEMYDKDGTFNDIFNSLGVDLNNLKWDSQEQIEKFCVENRSELRTDGWGTFFLFEEKVDGKKEYFVAHVTFDDDGRPELYVGRLSDDDIWVAGHRRRFVLPATWRLGSKN